MNPVYFELLRGTLDDKLPLSKLRANGLVWSRIFYWVEWYKKHIIPNEYAYKIMNNYYAFYRPFKLIEFPTPTDIQINMMPIQLNNPASYPENIKNYSNIIRLCSLFSSRGYEYPLPNDKIVYLTIHESLVPVGESQRRPGLHIERPGICDLGGHILKRNYKDPLYFNITWGSGFYGDDVPVDGIFMASSVSNACQIWPCQIDKPHEVSDAHGGIEPMRSELGEPYKIQKNEMVWFTDTTPHESLPLESETNETHVYRQFFRLVMGKISVWYSQHNTPNPLGVLPDAPISDVNKFQ